MDSSASFHIVYQDTDILVVDKPAGVIVNRADTTKKVVTLQDWVDQHFHHSSSNASEFESRSGIVHRLDKDTSGLIIIALNENVFTALQRQFKERTVHKTYTALTHGHVMPAEGEIHVPVGRLAWDRKKFGVVASGRESMTEYKVVAYKSAQEGKSVRQYTLVLCFPHTGRTHQIRVHMRYLGFPIVGDLLYAGRKNIQHDKKIITRHFLHASQICFTHPITQQELVLDSELPQELVDFLARLQ